MKCSKCGHEMPGNAKFCEMCGAPIRDESISPSEQTQLADDDFSEESRDSFQNDYQGVFRDDPNSFNSYENDSMQGGYPSGYPGDYPSGYPNDYPGGYPNDGYPDQRFDGRSTEYRQDYNGGPVYDDPYGNNRNRKPRMSSQKKALIISGISLVLVVAILGSVIFFVSRNKVSAAELEEAKENFRAPAEVIAIDTSLEDPSNDDIQFKYDSRARISSCTYDVNDMTYDQTYSYNDKERKIKIDTKYRKHSIYTKDISYDLVSAADVFEDIEGYYIRMDEKSLGIETHSVSSVPIETESPKPPASRPDNGGGSYVKPTDKPTEKPTEKPKATTKPKETTASAPETLERYQELYINFLDSTSISYSYGTLIYLDGDDTPELILWSSGRQVPYYICYIKNDKVQSYETADSHSLEYTEQGGYFTTGTYDQTGYIYYFDGSSVSKEHTYSYNLDDDEYYIDDESLTRDEYMETIDTVYLITDRKKDASNDPHEKSSLKEYISNY